MITRSAVICAHCSVWPISTAIRVLTNDGELGRAGIAAASRTALRPFELAHHQVHDDLAGEGGVEPLMRRVDDVADG
ncbi:hypothetical protein [Rhizobium sp. YS-1r]|uniref:hypothetical protein n=1 Tax=Rhizobium sp. YS-1r TaxID=1532558 RepID=UPI00190FB037|nr:hypothetical protein [Rhizobium sp. YS-1r]